MRDISIVLARLFACQSLWLRRHAAVCIAESSQPAGVPSQSDAVALVKMKRALNEAMPKLLATPGETRFSECPD